jgi:hypothetical protein
LASAKDIPWQFGEPYQKGYGFQVEQKSIDSLPAKEYLKPTNPEQHSQTGSKGLQSAWDKENHDETFARL